jgi:hypothetical protein
VAAGDGSVVAVFPALAAAALAAAAAALAAAAAALAAAAAALAAGVGGRGAAGVVVTTGAGSPAQATSSASRARVKGCEEAIWLNRRIAPAAPWWSAAICGARLFRSILPPRTVPKLCLIKHVKAGLTSRVATTPIRSQLSSWAC